MDTLNMAKALSANTPATTKPEKQYEVIQDYYDIAGPDYEVWSKQFNMHFGYARSFTDIFSLEKMLVNMSSEVIDQLGIAENEKAIIADLGCGVGTVARYTAKRFPLATVTGATISQYQIDKANVLNIAEGLNERITIENENFEHLRYKDETFTHSYALESACHANGANKELFIAEMARTLKKGGHFSIADGFLKPATKRPALFSKLSKKVAAYWAVPEFANLNEFVETLKAYGLENINVREISLRIAPSVLYVPWTCVKFFAREIWNSKSLRMKKERWDNVYAPVLGMILGLYRKHFGYYIISGRKGV